MRLALAFLLCPLAALADGTSDGDQPYAGFETREIKGLSPQDIAELQAGGGWGLALPAELNGLPGPRHLLDLANELELSAEQVAQIQTIFDEMQANAIVAGERFIAAEAALSDAFAGPAPTAETLDALLAEAAEARQALRFVHLSTHLATPALLTPHQQQRYSVLRGYAGDPCASVPEGHNPDLWRKHNGCTD